MTTFVMIVRADNDAFTPYPQDETARLLRDAADRMDSGMLEGPVKDINGSTVGLYCLSNDNPTDTTAQAIADVYEPPTDDVDDKVAGAHGVFDAPAPAEPNYPWVEVDLGDLNGPQGNAFAVLANTVQAMRSHGISDEEVAAYKAEAMASDYENLLAVTSKWVTVV